MAQLKSNIYLICLIYGADFVIITAPKTLMLIKVGLLSIKTFKPYLVHLCNEINSHLLKNDFDLPKAKLKCIKFKGDN